LTFNDSLADSVAFGDEMSQTLKNEIDAYIARENIAASVATPDPAETAAPRFPDPPILEIDPVRDGITTVIWSTGFDGDFGWLSVPGATGENGTPVQDRCVSVPGVYFAGLDTLDSLRAGTVLAATEEAERIVGHIEASRRSL
jgi:putative flavoprotein involved in K+ transport